MAFTIDELPIILSEFCPDGTGVPVGKEITGSVHLTKFPSGNFNAYAFCSGGSNKCELTTSTGLLLEKFDGIGEFTHGGIIDCVEGTYINYSATYITPNSVYLRISYPDKRLYVTWHSPDWVSNPASINYFEKPKAEEDWNYGYAAPIGNQYVLLQFYDSTVEDVSPGLEWIKVGMSSYAVKIPEIGEDRVTSWSLTLNPINKYAYNPNPTTIVLHRIKLWLDSYNITLNKGVNRITLKDIRWGTRISPYLIKLEPVETERNYIISQQLSNDGKNWYLTLSPNNGPDRVSKYKIKYGEWEDPEIVTIVQKGSVEYNFSVTPNSLNIGSNGGSLTSTIDTNYPSFTNSPIPNWINKFQYTPNKPGSIDIQISPNTSIDNRKAEIQFKSGDIVLDTLVINQEKQALYFEVEPSSITAPKEGGLYTVIVKTNMQYKMEVKNNTTDSGESWFVVSQANAAIKEIPYTVVVLPNKSSKGFNGSIVFTPTGMPVKTVLVSIAGDTPYIKYTPNYTEIDENSHTWEVVREHNIPEITEKENLVGLSYIIKPPNNGGSNSDIVVTPPEYPKITTYIISASKNESSSDRSSYLETSGSGVSARYNVVQRSNIIFDVLEYPSYNQIRNINVPADGATIDIAVRYNVSWDSINNDASWIYLTNESQPNPDYTKDYLTSITIEKNIEGIREGTITFKSQRGGTITLRIHQDADIVRSIEVTPNYTTLDSNSHAIILTVKASHDWNLAQGVKYILPDWIDIDKVEGLAGTTEITVKIKQALLKKRVAMLYFKLKEFELFDVATIVQNAIENGYDITDVENDSDWSKRMEAKIRDKYVKVKIRYTGNDLAIITALKTLYETSYA